MRNYYPDTWVIIEYKKEGDTYHRILASFMGGFARSDEWKLSSAIEKISIKEVNGEILYVVENCSGSIYLCHGLSERLNRLTNQIYENILLTPASFEIRIVDMKEIVPLYKP